MGALLIYVFGSVIYAMATAPFVHEIWARDGRYALALACAASAMLPFCLVEDLTARSCFASAHEKMTLEA